MIVANFIDNYKDYDNFQIWEFENINDFFKGNSVLVDILQRDFDETPINFFENRSAINETDLDLIHKILEQVEDKHFYVFMFQDSNHLELIEMQEQELMSFGIDLKIIKQQHTFVIIMDKKAEGLAL